jgi:hypothetical protein
MSKGNKCGIALVLVYEQQARNVNSNNFKHQNFHDSLDTRNVKRKEIRNKEQRRRIVLLKKKKD